MAGRIEWVHEPARFAALAEDWEAVAAASDSPFADHAWFRAWWEAFGTGRLAVCVLWEDGQMQAALPLCTGRGRRWAGLSGLANYHTPLFAAPARDERALGAVIDEAVERAGGELTLQPVDPAGPISRELGEAGGRRKRLLLVEDLYRSPRVEMKGEFETYIQGRGRGFKGIRRRWRKLNREHEVRFRFDETSQNLEAELQTGFELEASGWKGRRRTAILSSPETRAFYTDLARTYHARGQLRLLWLDIDGQPAAFSFCLLKGNRLYSLKIGIDDGLRPHAPGIMMDYATVHRCFELGLDSFELLGAEETQKASFATATSARVRLRSYRRHPAPVTRYLTRRIARPLVLSARERLAR